MSRKEISDKILDKFKSKFETIQIISIETMCLNIPLKNTSIVHNLASRRDLRTPLKRQIGRQISISRTLFFKGERNIITISINNQTALYVTDL